MTVTAPADAAPDPAILTPPGLPILDAAAWLGHACWAELRLQEVLTAWLAVEPDPEHALVLWRERADAAERAESWYHRLPELREFPQASFLVPCSPSVADLFDQLAALDAPASSPARRGALAAVLRGLRVGYHRRQEVAVGPADGPTAVSIGVALRSTFGVGGWDPAPEWTRAVEVAGGLP